MSDSWNPAVLNSDIPKVDSWNTAKLNNFVKRKDTWNAAELNDFITTKRDLEAIREATIQSGIAHFSTYESDTVVSASGEIEGTISDFHIIHDVTVDLPHNTDVYNFQPIPEIGNRTKQLIPKIIGGSVVWNQLVDTNTESVTIPSGHKYILWNGSALSLATSDGTAVSVTGGTDKFYDITQMFGTSVANQMTTAKFAQLFPNYASYAYSAPTIQSTKVSSKVVKDANDQTIATYDLSGSHVVSRKYALVDLGTLDWYNQGSYFYCSILSLPAPKRPELDSVAFNGICEEYTVSFLNDTTDKIITMNRTGSVRLYIRDNSKSSMTGEQFATALSGVYLLYELATPTTETVTNPTLYGLWKLDANNNLYFDGDEIEELFIMDVEPGGTEEYIDSEVESENRDVSIPISSDEWYAKNVITVSIPDPPETVTDCTFIIDKSGNVTITDNVGEEPETYETTIDPIITFQGENVVGLWYGNITELLYTLVTPKPLSKSKKKTKKGGN